MLELRAVAYDHPDVAVLVAAVQWEYVLRYGGGDATPVDPAEFVPPHWAVVGAGAAGTGCVLAAVCAVRATRPSGQAVSAD